MNVKRIADRLFKEFSPVHRETVRVIYRAETQAPSIGVSVPSLLNRYAEELERYGKKQEKEVSRRLRSLARKIEEGTPSWQVYKGVLPEDIVSLLREASDAKSVPPQKIFEEYVPLKEMGEQALRSTRRKLYFPLALFFISVYALKGTVDVYLNIGTSGGQSFPPALTFVLENFLPINFAIGFFLVILFMFFPDKLPGFKSIFRAINGFLALGIIKVMNAFTFSPEEIIEVVEKEFTNKKILGRNIDALANLLRISKILSPAEAVEVKISAENGRMGEGINLILEERKQSIQDLNDMLQSAVGVISILILAIPVSMVVMAMGQMLMNSSSLTSGAGMP
jgi:hypothetical protein